MHRFFGYIKRQLFNKWFIEFDSLCAKLFNAHGMSATIAVSYICAIAATCII